ncbi:MAG: LPP20 family lipoprotein [Selenomonadaceae bacterium]|nr:LPP20 family lipoprotein [Selenomonadaceae bacterium]
MKKSFLRNLLAVLSTMILLTAIAFAAADGLNWQDATITVTGMGVGPQNAANQAQRTMLARRAAVVDGYRQLAESINGVQVDAESTVENLIITSDVVRTKVSALIRGAQVISERPVEGGYEVTMKIAMFGSSNSLAEAVLPSTGKREDFPKPVQSVAPSMPAYDSNTSIDIRIDVTSKQTAPTAAPNDNAIGGYTGLIVDCRGLNLNPVMSPVIKNADGESIYGHKNLDPDYVIANGMASYTTDINASDRAGNNPLVVKATSVENHNGYPVLSTADANRVLIENKASGFLDKTKVVFVR